MYLKLGRWCYRNRVLVAVVWLVAFVAINALSAASGSDFSGDPEAPESESRTGFELLDERFGGLGAGNPGSIVIQADQGVDDPAVVAAVGELIALATENEHINAVSPYEPQGARQIAQEGELAGKLAYVSLDIGMDVTFEQSGELGGELEDLGTELEAEVPGLRVEIGGQSLAGFEPPQSEVIGLAFAIVVLIVSFGSVLAMGLPIIVAIAGVGIGIAITGLLSNVLAMPDFASFIGVMIGLGVGIDYALFIVTRYREGLHQGLDPEVATAASHDTAGRAVIFAGVTVVVSLLGLLMMGLPFVAGLGVSAAATVTVTMLASVTLLPALLGFAKLKVEITRWRGLVSAGFAALALLAVGFKLYPVAGVAAILAVVSVIVGSFLPILKREVPKRKTKPVEESGWYRWSHLIQDRPWPFVIGSVALLLFLTVPLFALRFGFSDEGNFAEETTTRQAYDLLSEGFGPGFNGPFFVVAELDSPEQMEQVNALVARIGEDPGVASVTPALPNTFADPELAAPTAALIQVIPTTSPQSLETEQLIKRLRAEVIPATVGEDGPEISVTGMGPVSIDFSDYLGARTAIFFGVVLLLSFLLLLGVFRSLLVPLKAVIMNSLSISAAYGIVVALFQWGHLGSITGIEGAPIEPFIPMMMFAIVFGLSMDYEVFLLSRIKEEYEHTGNAKDSVANGLSATARVISAAAAIMVVVFGSFLFEDDRVTKLFGVGLGTAVLIDATLVRMLLVPATMELLGDRNWWIPKWLDRIIPQLNVEGSTDHEERIAEMQRELVPGWTPPTADEATVPAVAGATAGGAKRRAQPLRVGDRLPGDD